jgi:hypothetical protein
MKKTAITLLSFAAAHALCAAPPINEHFQCTAREFFNRLQIEVNTGPDTVQVTLQGLSAGSAALALGLVTGEQPADQLVVAFPKAWCAVSAQTLNVVSCEVPSWQFPAPKLAVAVRDNQGNSLAQGQLAVYSLDLAYEQVTRAASGGDIHSERIELEANLISDADNAKRADLRLPYQASDCRAVKPRSF